ncbi:DUF6089 family protein [Tenuifilum sp.]|uniref:DUF6089 family protein n=1 Tax=Tenuifilum sp. TaxID=2760880 RepID=UPI00258DF275|nr:DUF6089 family protein [Tenuifilum sp.]
MEILMKFSHSVILMFFLFSNAFSSLAQEKRDIGIQAGASYYYGEFNEVKPLYSPSFSLGVIFRYNITPNYSIRASGAYAVVNGSSSNANIIPDPNISFSKRIIGAEIMGEFNFFSIKPVSQREKKISPYVNLGVGFAQVGTAYILHIPFGGGIKYAPGNRHTFALEWRLHKTFYDMIDDYSSPDDGRKALLHNNDWFSFIGLVYTYRLPNNNYICPAYR